MKIVKGERSVDRTDVSGEVNMTIGRMPVDIDKLPKIAVHTSIKKAPVKPIYEKLAPNEVFIISLQGATLLYVVNRLGTAHLQQATLE